MTQMKILIFLFITIAMTFPISAVADTEDEPMRPKIESFVLKHYFDGIQYKEAKALGPLAIPYLIELLNKKEVKEYWVNIIVTIGFIESSTGLDAIISFLEQAKGEVDIHTFRALLSVPFSIGCISSNGDTKAFEYLVGRIHTPEKFPADWSFRGKKTGLLIASQSITGLAVSGSPAAKAELLKLQTNIESNNAPKDHHYYMENLLNGLDTMARIEKEGRGQIFNYNR